MVGSRRSTLTDLRTGMERPWLIVGPWGRHSHGLCSMSRTARVLFVTVTCTCATTAIIISGRWRGDAGGEPSGALSRSLVRESGTHLQPRNRIVYQHAPLVYGLGCVVLAWSAPLCPSLVGAQLRAELQDGHEITLSDDAIAHYMGLYQTMLAARQQDPERLADD